MSNLPHINIKIFKYKLTRVQFH